MTRLAETLKNNQMKKMLISATFMAIISLGASAQEYKLITTIESIVPMGIGRSRIVEFNQPMDYKALTTEETGGKDDGDKPDRSDAKIERYYETKLLNFYSGVGINFGNVAANDAIISSKLTDMAKEGWQLVNVSTGVESKGSSDDKQGIFITRYLFKR